jgi:hypothetical protein
MNAEDLVRSLNGYPRWTEFDAETRADIFSAIGELSELFRRSDLQDRQLISAGLQDTAKFQMYEYSRARATEAAVARLEDAVVDGLIPVVMGGGSSDTGTGGSLMAVLFRAAEIAGANAIRLFDVAAESATSESQASDLRSFPLTFNDRGGLGRYGIREVRNDAGVAWELAGERPVRWWDPLRARCTVSKAELWKMMRDIDEYWKSNSPPVPRSD